MGIFLNENIDHTISTVCMPYIAYNGGTLPFLSKDSVYALWEKLYEQYGKALTYSEEDFAVKNGMIGPMPFTEIVLPTTADGHILYKKIYITAEENDTDKVRQFYTVAYDRTAPVRDLLNCYLLRVEKDLTESFFGSHDILRMGIPHSTKKEEEMFKNFVDPAFIFVIQGMYLFDGITGATLPPLRTARFLEANHRADLDIAKKALDSLWG